MHFYLADSENSGNCPSPLEWIRAPRTGEGKIDLFDGSCPGSTHPDVAGLPYFIGKVRPATCDRPEASQKKEAPKRGKCFEVT